MMFRLRWNDVPVAQEGMADRLVDGLVDIPVFGVYLSVFMLLVFREL